MDTMTDVHVEELCTSTVNRTPIMRPTTGLERSSSLRKTLPESEFKSAVDRPELMGYSNIHFQRHRFA